MYLLNIPMMHCSTMFYHRTNENRRIINTQLKRDVISQTQVLLGYHQGVINSLSCPIVCEY